MTPQQAAIRVIQEEHRTLSAVTDALHQVAREVGQGRLAPDYKLLWSLICYIDEFPDRLHHPKEDEVLFPRIRQRTHDIDATLDDLTRQHHNGVVHLNRLKTLLGRMEAGIPDAAAQFAERAGVYAGFHFAHMNQEETIVLRKAAQVLLPEDWEAIAQAFSENTDPLGLNGGGDDEWFRLLYRRIVALVPPPWGVGERREPTKG